MKNNEKKTIEAIKRSGFGFRNIGIRIIRWISHFQHVFWVICITISLLLLAMLMPHNIWEKIWVSLGAQHKLVALGLVFCMIALSLVWSLGQKIDEWIFMNFNSNGQRARWLDLTMLWFTQLGNFIFALIVTIILFISGHRMMAYELALGILTLGLIVQCLKVLIRRTRPYNKLKGMRVVGPRNGGHSFPSGHTSQAFFMASLLLQYFHVNTFVWLAVYAVAVFVGLTRIYVGMHYPRDVIAGAILGTAWGIIWMSINIYIFNYLNIY